MNTEFIHAVLQAAGLKMSNNQIDSLKDIFTELYESKVNETAQDIEGSINEFLAEKEDCMTARLSDLIKVLPLQLRLKIDSHDDEVVEQIKGFLIKLYH